MCFVNNELAKAELGKDESKAARPRKGRWVKKGGGIAKVSRLHGQVAVELPAQIPNRQEGRKGFVIRRSSQLANPALQKGAQLGKRAGSHLCEAFDENSSNRNRKLARCRCVSTQER
jgi:hypothetical protein